MSTSIEHLAHSNHAPVNLAELSADDQYCELIPGRVRRHDSLEAVRYLVLTTQDLVEAIQNQWPCDRPQPPDLQAKLSFGVMAVARVRNGDLRRLAESAQS